LSGLKNDYDVFKAMEKQVSTSKSELVIAQDVPLPFAQLERFKDDDFNDWLTSDQSIIVQSVAEEESKEQPLRSHGQQV
jgi:hypothetical protein